MHHKHWKDERGEHASDDRDEQRGMKGRKKNIAAGWVDHQSNLYGSPQGHEAEHDDAMGNAALFCGIQCKGIVFELAREHRGDGQGRRSRKPKVRVVEAGEREIGRAHV